MSFIKSIATATALLAFSCLAFAQSTTTTTAAPTATATTSGPTDPQIAHIVVTANKIDIDAAKLAESKLKSFKPKEKAEKQEAKEVLAFAKLMVKDHSAVNEKAVALAKKLKVTPEDNDTSKALLKGAEENMTTLKGLQGHDFEKAYVDHEVDYHQQVVDAIEKTLIPNAKNPELKALLEKTQPAIVAHLEHAKKLQSTLSK